MKKFIIILIIFFNILLTSNNNVLAYEYNITVLPTEIFKVCDNYYCFPEPSEILANSVIENLDNYKNIHVINLNTIREILNKNQNLKYDTEQMLYNYEKSEKIDFETLKKLADTFNTKSILLISANVTSEKANAKRNLWEILEISNAFKINNPFYLNTNVALTDTVNSVVMWGNKYQKRLNNNEGEFLTKNMLEATSQLEKITQYYKNTITQSIVQNVHLRFFPKSIRTFEPKNKDYIEKQKTLPPNASEYFREEQIRRVNEDESIEPHFDNYEDFVFSL